MIIVSTPTSPIGVRAHGTTSVAIVTGHSTVIIDAQSWPAVQAAVNEVIGQGGQLGHLYSSRKAS